MREKKVRGEYIKKLLVHFVHSFKGPDYDPVTLYDCFCDLF